MTRLPPQAAFRYMMGAGAREWPDTEWEAFQRVAATFVAEAFGPEVANE